jgi:hypothetical protein
MDEWGNSDEGTSLRGQVMVDFARLTIIHTTDTYPRHELPFLTWVTLALVYQLQPATNEDHPGAHAPD